MLSEFETSSSTVEKLTLLVFIAAIIIGNICVFVTYFLRTSGKHWSHMFVLGMAFIDLFIGGFVLPMRFQSTYGSPLTSKLCAASSIGESCALASVIYAIGFMIYTRLYYLKNASTSFHRRYPLMLLLVSWVASFIFYGIPFMTNNSIDHLKVVSSTTNAAFYCTTYAIFIHHPNWMAYTEIGIMYSLPFLCILIGLLFLIRHLCQSKPIELDKMQRKEYYQQKQMTWHVVILTITFICLWLPWATTRILIIFYKTNEIQHTLQITYYILILKSAVFPVLYASTNASFRGSFAIYRHKRITFNNRVWTVNESLRN
ncbi:unnamed protein product [Rotaria socialis]|uniref:G-protein coupled receptors family 1 profile domain-containing protein n=1 Tax=Rotaria socialis TaxID=392032 RepID=A0A818HJH5_9BILA|nr:unnamed protein product [Rotaria socialis]CAF3505235.1 unnamed protein product [Rotaria socialis]CAF4379377.1 unnamed protein product [Rotaria socialis]CAF4635646.1 unnamed protein product [Rotaria socialis]